MIGPQLICSLFVVTCIDQNPNLTLKCIKMHVINVDIESLINLCLKIYLRTWLIRIFLSLD